MKISNFRIIPIVIGLLLCQVQACKSSNKKGWYVKVNKAEYEAKVKELEANYSPVKKTRSHSRPDSAQSSSIRNLRSSNESSSVEYSPKCFICDTDNGARLWKAATFGLNSRVKYCANVTKNEKLLRKFVDGDLIAIEAEYHVGCLSKLYREAAAHERGTNGNTKEEIVKRELIFQELIDYLEGYRGTLTRIPMCNISKMYQNELTNHGLDGIVHTTRLRGIILAAIPDITEVQHQNGTWDLVFDSDLSEKVNEMDRMDTEFSASEQVMLFAKLSKFFRKDILSKKQSFNGKFTEESERSSVPDSLITFLRMLIDGPSFLSSNSSENRFSSEPIVLSVAQQITYNTVDKRSLTATHTRHLKDRVTPFPLYVGIKTYLQSGHHMVDILHSRGISVSYSVVKNLSIDIANSVIKFWDEKGLVVPPGAKKGCFTIVGFDNVDWNAMAALSKAASTIHGTIIVVHQFQIDNNGFDQNVDILCKEASGLKSIKMLPPYYNNVGDDYVITDDDKLYIPSVNTTITPHSIPSSELLRAQFLWLEHASQLVQKAQLDKKDWVSFSAFNASLQTKQIFVSRIISNVMPLLLQKSSDPSTIAHVLKIACRLVNYLNPGQVAVVETDQPLFQTAKKLQAKYPDEEFSEEKLFLSLGSLHTEKMLWQMSGDLQDGSGIVTAFANSGIETFGTKTFLICNSITATRHHKQILVLALEILKQRAFNESQATEKETDDLLFGETEDFDLWLTRIKEEQPQAAYFSLCQEVDLLILELVRCCRVSDLDGFTKVLTSLMPYVFALDRTHYLRNLPVYLRDLMSLKDRHPSLYTEFKENGNFMGRKTGKRFSSIPIDQCTEQEVCWLKNEGGVIGNLDNEQTVRRHQASIPEMMRMVKEFEKSPIVKHSHTEDHTIRCQL